MRIALVHSFYSSRQPSGENAVVESQYNALRRAGYEVQLFAAHTDHLEGSLLYPVRAAFRVATGRGANPLKAIRRFRPDVVHIHNLFPNFGRRWVNDLDVPVIHTLHNYRPLCANGLLLRAGRVCTDCLNGRRWSGLAHACYRGSHLATLPPAWAGRKGPLADPVISRADRLLVLTKLQRDLYARAGVPRQKMSVAPNFLPDELDAGFDPVARRRGFLFVGRLTEEKGIVKLLERWPSGTTLQIIGDGPAREQVERLARARDGVTLMRRASRREVLNAMRHCGYLVFPSVWYEGLPLVYLEALSCGLPVLAFQPCAPAQLVRSERTGLSLTWEQPVSDMIAALPRPSPDLQAACRRTFEARYSEDAFLCRFASLVASVISPNG